MMMIPLVAVLVDYQIWELKVDVIFNLSASVDGWIELTITELALYHRQRISIDVNSSTVHIFTSATQVFLNKLIS